MTERKFACGDRVVVFGIKIFQRPYIEGRATIVEALPEDPEFYRVLFDGDRCPRERLVHAGDWQSDPEGLLARLISEWRLAMTPEIISEFFPEDAEDNNV